MNRRWAFLSLLILLIFGREEPLLAKQPARKAARLLLNEIVNVQRLKGDYLGEEQIKRMIEKHFDFVTFTRWSLNDHWGSLSEADKAEFERVFRRRFTDHIAKKFVASDFQWSQVKIFSEKNEGSYHELFSEVYRNQDRFEIKSKWVSTKQGWKVFDISVSKANLIANYQGQFNNIIREHGFKELLRRIDAKILR